MVGVKEVIILKFDSIKLEACNIIHEVVNIKNMMNGFIFYPRTTAHYMSFFIANMRVCIYIKENSSKRAQEKLFVT